MAFAGGAAAGFLVPVAPFALAAPSKFYQSVVLAQAAQLGRRLGVMRVGLLDRFYKMAGLGDLQVKSRRAQVSFLFIHLSAPLKAVNWPCPVPMAIPAIRPPHSAHRIAIKICAPLFSAYLRRRLRRQALSTNDQVVPVTPRSRTQMALGQGQAWAAVASSAGKKLSRRISWSIASCGVPSVVTAEK